jgi:hypothetical protein
MKKYFKYLSEEGKGWVGVILFILTILILFIFRGLKEVIDGYGIWTGISMCGFLLLIIGSVINHTIKKSRL